MESKREDRRKFRQKVYNTKRWRDLRTQKIQEQPLCQDCLKEGKITPAQEVHHIKSFCKRGLTPEEVEKRAFDYDNLVCLCKSCHIKRHTPDGMTMKDKLLKYS